MIIIIGIVLGYLFSTKALLKMQKTLSLMLLAAALLTGCNQDSGKIDPWTQYFTLATKLEAQIPQMPLDKVADSASELTLLSKQILPAFVQQQPVCSAYIQAAMEAADSMLTLSLEQIERDYHADGKLPPMQQAVCYHAKDLLVHPATVAVIAKTQADSDETREKLAHELEEVLEHFNQVKQNAGL